MQSGTVFNVWKDGEIHPTAVLAISGLGFDSLSNLQIGWCFLDTIKVLLIVRVFVISSPFGFQRNDRVSAVCHCSIF